MSTRLWFPLWISTLIGCGSVNSEQPADANVTPDAPDTPDPDAAVDGPPPQPEPILAWTFDGNADNTGTTPGFALSLNGTTTFINGKFGQAIEFSSGSFSSVDGVREVLAVSPTYTISFWARASALPNSIIALDFNNRSNAPFGGIQMATFNGNFATCVSTTRTGFLGGSCGAVPAFPTDGAFHNVLVRYEGTGLANGEGAPVDFFVDGVLVHTRAQDGNNDPVFNPGMRDTLNVGSFPAGAAGTFVMDEVRIYDRVFDEVEQCTVVIGGTFADGACTLP